MKYGNTHCSLDEDENSLCKLSPLMENCTQAWDIIAVAGGRSTSREHLSVTQLILKINSIIKTINRGIKKSLYVDDFSISYWSSNMASLEKYLQTCLHKIERWTNKNGFHLSKTKTVCISVKNRA